MCTYTTSYIYWDSIHLLMNGSEKCRRFLFYVKEDKKWNCSVKIGNIGEEFGTTCLITIIY